MSVRQENPSPELGFVVKAWDRLVASDPGLARLQMATCSAVAVASTLGIEYLLSVVLHTGGMPMIVGMLLGAIVAMMGTMGLALHKGIWPKVRTAAFFPVAIGVGMALGALVSGNKDLMLGVFVVMMFAAVFVRRFGPAFFFYGFMGWMGYFFASFLGATFATLPLYLLSIVVGTAWVLLLSITVLRTNPERFLRRTLRAYRARVRSFTSLCAELLRSEPGPGRDRLLRRVRTR